MDSPGILETEHIIFTKEPSGFKQQLEIPIYRAFSEWTVSGRRTKSLQCFAERPSSGKPNCLPPCNDQQEQGRILVWWFSALGIQGQSQPVRENAPMGINPETDTSSSVMGLPFWAHTNLERILNSTWQVLSRFWFQTFWCRNCHLGYVQRRLAHRSPCCGCECSWITPLPKQWLTLPGLRRGIWL